MTRNTSWALAGNTVYAACQWVVFILLARSLGLSEVGEFAYATAIAGPVFVLANLRLRNLLAAEDGSSRDFADYLSARLMTTAAAVVASLGIAVAVSSAPGPFTVLVLVVAARGCEAVSDIVHGLFQRQLDIRSQAIGLILNGSLSLGLVFVSLTLSPSLVLATAGYAAGSCLALFVWDLPRSARWTVFRGEHGATSGSLGRGLQVVVTALPLGVSSAIGSLQSSLPRYVITAHLGPAALAVFAAVSYIPMLGHLVVNAASQAALPVLARHARVSPARYRILLGRLVGSSVVFGLLGLLTAVAIGRDVLAWIYGNEYGDQVSLLSWLVAVAVITFVSVFLGTGITARLRFAVQPAISASSLVVVAATIVPLVKADGLSGAAWSLLAGAVVELCAYAGLTLRDLRKGERAVDVVPGALAGGVRR